MANTSRDTVTFCRQRNAHVFAFRAVALSVQCTHACVPTMHVDIWLQEITRAGMQKTLLCVLVRERMSQSACVRVNWCLGSTLKTQDDMKRARCTVT